MESCEIQKLVSWGWQEHAKNSEEVANKLEARIDDLTSVEDLSDFGSLLLHVYGEHLKNFDRGIELFEALKVKFSNDEAANKVCLRYLDILNLVKGGQIDTNKWSDSDLVRIYANVTSMFMGIDKLEKSKKFFDLAVAHIKNDFLKDDMSYRAIAVTSNNLACDLEEKKDRSESETELMVKAALAGRKYWEISGTWVNVERAEYRLSKTYIQAGQIQKAVEHANECLNICLKNEAPHLEFFFAYEVLAQSAKENADHAKMKEYVERAIEHFASLEEGDQQWCATTRDQLVAMN